MDIILITGTKALPEGDSFSLMMVIINLLVLGFLFGERAVLNMQPLIMRVLELILDKRTRK